MTDAIYLNPQEIEKIHRLKLTGSMAAIRDRFVIGCVTGLRFGDYSRFGPGHIQNGLITILTQKKRRKVVIPAHKFVLDILKRNYNDLPPSKTLRYFNMVLPQIGLKAGIREPIMIENVVEVKKNFTAADLIEGLEHQTTRKVLTTQVPKHELISTHTARRSFATNAYLAGIPAAKIMLITGHKTESSFFRYVRIAATENAKELKGHHFFK